MRAQLLTIAAGLILINTYSGMSAPLTDPSTPPSYSSSAPTSSPAPTYSLTEEHKAEEQPTTEKENNEARAEGAEEDEISPGTSIPAEVGSRNTFTFSSWLFYDVSVPVVRVDEVKLEKGEEEYEVDGYIPVLRFDVNPGWELVEEDLDGARLRRVWMYTTPVDVGESYTPLFDSWIMTNFRISNNYSGEYTYEEIVDLLNENVVTRRALQSKGIDGTPQDLWSMIRPVE